MSKNSFEEVSPTVNRLFRLCADLSLRALREDNFCDYKISNWAAQIY